MKIIFTICLAVLSITSLHAQSIQKMAASALIEMQPRYDKLKDADINIKIRNRGSAMGASYTWWSVFRKPAKRKYNVLINNNVSGSYMCFQFDNLSAVSRKGVMAHELAHVDFFHSLNFFGFMKFIINQALPNGLRKSERATDYRTIKNGMGQELRFWSNETRTRFLESEGKDIPAKFGSRYLTPNEIDSVMELFPKLYPSLE